MSLTAQQTIGLVTQPAQAQSRPIQLPLLGTTKYDETQITKVRSFFKGRVEKVHVTLGQTVRVGDPLFELYSTDLAQAKKDYEIERSQWEYEKNLLAKRTDLVKSHAIAEQQLLDSQNAERRERHEYDQARNKLLVYGLTPHEIEHLSDESGPSRAILTVRSPSNGVVISREAVPGNLYEEGEMLLTVAPTDHLWVWGDVFEQDLNQIEMGQKWSIEFPFLEKKVDGRIDYIADAIDPLSHAVKVRTSIANEGGRLKADMPVRGAVEIPPSPNRVMIPRSAMIVVDGASYAFVRNSSHEDHFQRRKLQVVYEKEDFVVIDSGLGVEEPVVVSGALLLQQIYEEEAAARPLAGQATNPS